MNDELREKITERFINPLNRKATDLVGVEIELPIVNLKKEPVDFALCQDMMDSFRVEYGFDNGLMDDDGCVYNASDPVTGDSISFDCSYNTLEFSFAPEEDITPAEKRFRRYYQFCEDFLMDRGHTLTGMGINPHLQYNRNIPIKNDRYRMLFHHLSSYEKYSRDVPFHNYPNFGLFSCASQVQMDVDRENYIETLNTFTRLEPLKAVLMANSLLPGDREKILNRDDLWENSLHGLNRHNVGMLDTVLRSEDDMINYIGSMSMYCVGKDGKYLNFAPTPLYEYAEKQVMTGEYYDRELGAYREVPFKPDASDIKDLRSFKFEDLTFRGTVEFRSTCTQPVSEEFANAALHAGLMKKIPELSELLASDKIIYGHGFNPTELRRFFQYRHYPEFVDLYSLRWLLHRVLDIASEGLKERGHNEEHFLEPLYDRAERLMSPGAEIAEGLDKGESIEYFIKKFGTL